MLATGQKAPVFTLPELDGSEVALPAALAGGAVLVFFKASCPTCQFTLPYFETLGRAGAKVILISQDDAASTRAFHQHFGITLPTLLDARPYPVSNAYRLTNVPSIFVLSADGRITTAAHGFDKSLLERLGHDAGVELFGPADRVPAFKPG